MDVTVFCIAKGVTYVRRVQSSATGLSWFGAFDTDILMPIPKLRYRFGSSRRSPYGFPTASGGLRSKNNKI